jgi:hypothetical protein
LCFLRLNSYFVFFFSFISFFIEVLDMDLKAMLAARAASRGGLSTAGAAPAPPEEVARRRPLLLDAAEGETNALTSGRLYTWGRNDYGMAHTSQF